jgi:diguanylate cyclase (GGDEF)-like protein/PAS domain S-box-containing protein
MIRKSRTKNTTVTAAHEQRDDALFALHIAGVEDYAILILDTKGLVTTWNAGAQRVKGYASEEIIGRHFSVFYPPEDVASGKPERELAVAAAEGRLEDEGWRVRRDGTRFWANVVITALRDSAGTLRGYGKITRDLTERRDAELALRASEERFRLIVEAVEDYAIFMLDATGHVATWNAGALRLKGYSPEDILGRHFSVFYPPDDVAAGKPERELAVADAAGRSEDEGWRVRRDGTWFWANVVITALRGPDGTLRGYTKVTRDLTERRGADLAVRISEERFRRFFDEAQIGMLIVSLDGHLQRANDAFAAIVGYEKGSLTGKQARSITHPEDLAAEAAMGRAMLAGSETSRVYEKRFVHAAGHPVWSSIHLTLIRDADARPSHYIAQVQDITERRSYERQLEYLADHDPLTGLLNRRAFHRELHGHLARVARYGAKGAVLMIDLDNFKYYNDTQGHNAGDQLIVRVARGLQSRIRESDVLARIGGDECAVLLPDGDETGTTIAAEALLEIVRHEAMPPVIGGNKRVTASIGIARFDDGAHLTVEDIMVNADLAMYDAKEAGGDRWARYRTSNRDRPAIATRIKWAEQINCALANDGFELHAEPIVRLTGGEATQFELLLRMHNGEGGLIPPGSFMEAAERLGLMADIDLWVAGRAIEMLAEQRALGRQLRFHVNLSGRTLGDDRLINLVRRQLHATAVSADQLVFEVTETSAIANIGEAVRFVKRLSDLGCRLAIDDFGSGFGSFYYLKHLPFDYLKIDGEFVKNCAENETDRFVIAAIVQLARGMGKITIGEFVASQETANALRDLGVDYGQGFFVGRAAPLAQHLSPLVQPD